MCQSLDELINSRSLHLNQIAIWTSICKYYDLKSRFKYESCMSLYEWSRRAVLFTNVTYTARVALVCSLNEDVNMNEWMNEAYI